MAAERAAATVLQSPVSAVSSEAHDAADRSRAARMVAEAAGLDTVTEEFTEEMVEVSSDDEDSDELVSSQAELMEFADALDIMAAALGEDTEEEYDIGLPGTDTIPATHYESL